MPFSFFDENILPIWAPWAGSYLNPWLPALVPPREAAAAAAAAAAVGLMDSNLQGDGLGRSGSCKRPRHVPWITVCPAQMAQPAHCKGLMGKCIKLLNA